MDRIRAWLLAVFGVLIAAAAARAEPVTIAGFPAVPTQVIYIAKEQGLFARHGLDANPIIMPLMTDIPPAILSGSVRIGITAATVLLQAANQGLDLVAVAGAYRSTQDYADFSLMAPPDGAVRSAADLRGKRVGIPAINALTDLLFQRWVRLHGLKPTELTEVEVAFPQMAGMMRSHQLDAAVMADPFRALAVGSNNAVLVSDFPKELVPQLLALVWVADRGWAVSHMAEVRGFRAGLAEGIEAWKHDPEARPIELKYLKRNAAEIEKTAVTTEVTLDDLKFNDDLTRQAGLIEGPVELPKLLLAN